MREINEIKVVLHFASSVFATPHPNFQHQLHIGLDVDLLEERSKNNRTLKVGIRMLKK